jgi:copper(I)-binding protein
MKTIKKLGGAALLFATTFSVAQAHVAFLDPQAPQEAPVLTVVAGAEHEHGHDGMAGMDMSGTAGDTVKLGDLDISGAFAKAMLPGQPVGGGFFTIRNNGKTDDRLVSVSSPNAGEVELHEMAMQGNIMKMRELKDGIAVPAGETVRLEPGNLHLMFQKVKAPFKQGDSVPVTLTFEKAGKVDVTLKVLSAQGK